MNIVEGIELKPCRSHGKWPWVCHNMLCEEDFPICQTNFRGNSVRNLVLFNEDILMDLKDMKVILCSSVALMQLSCM